LRYQRIGFFRIAKVVTLLLTFAGNPLEPAKLLLALMKYNAPEN
jgi:hypothetical protein